MIGKRWTSIPYLLYICWNINLILLLYHLRQIPEARRLSWCHDNTSLVTNQHVTGPGSYHLTQPGGEYFYSEFGHAVFILLLCSRLYLVMSIKIVHNTRDHRCRQGHMGIMCTSMLNFYPDQSGGWCGGVIRTCYIMLPTCENKYSNPTNKLPAVISSPRLTLVPSSRRQLSVSNVT